MRARMICVYQIHHYYLWLAVACMWINGKRLNSIDDFIVLLGLGKHALARFNTLLENCCCWITLRRTMNGEWMRNANMYHCTHFIIFCVTEHCVCVCVFCVLRIVSTIYALRIHIRQWVWCCRLYLWRYIYIRVGIVTLIAKPQCIEM